MKTDPAGTRRRFPARRLFVLVLFTFILIRGAALSTALMPDEGWDEYQHLGVASHVHRHRRMPGNTETLPRELWRFVRSHPHPDSAAMQLWGLGIRTYDGKAFLHDGEVYRKVSCRERDAAVRSPGTDRPPVLYQAQHGPLYYHLLAWVRTWFASVGAWADAARILNVLLAACVAVMWFSTLKRLMTDRLGGGVAFAVALMVAVNSLFLFNAARAANDMLAIFLGTVALFLYFRWFKPGGRSLGIAVILAAVLGLVVGVGVLAKTTVLVLVPLLGLGILVGARKTAAGPWAAPLPAIAFLLTYFVAAGPYHLECYQSLGTFTGMQEAANNARSGKTMADLLPATLSLTPRRLAANFLLDYLHTGGWSYLPYPRAPYTAFKYLVLAGAVFYLMALFRPARIKKLLSSLWHGWELVLLLLLTWAGLLYHSAHTILCWGEELTNAWYGMRSFPALAFFLVLGAFAFSQRAGAFLSLAYAAVFSWAFYLGTYGDLLSLETGGLPFFEALEEVASHHALLGLPVPFLLIGEAVLLAILIYQYCRVFTAPAPPESTA